MLAREKSNSWFLQSTYSQVYSILYNNTYLKMYIPIGMFVLIWVWKSKLLIYLSRFPLSLSSLYTTATVNKYDCENSWCCYNLVVMSWTSLNLNLFLFQNRSSSNIENKAGKNFFSKKNQSQKLGFRFECKPNLSPWFEFSFESKNRIQIIFSGFDPSLLHKITLYTPWCVSILQFHF